MAKVVLVARILLGVGFVVFGANSFLHFMPAPELPEAGGRFIGLMVDSGYFHVVAILKLAGGIMLLLGRFVPLGLTLLGPVLVNILLFHVFFDPKGILMGVIFTLLWCVIFWQRRAVFQAIWQAS